MLVDRNVGALMVVEGDRFVGVFSERDYARKVILRGKASRETFIREIMTAHPETICPDDTIEDCMQRMTDKRIRHLPVMEDAKLSGIISIGDVVKVIIDEQKYIIENLEDRQRVVSGKSVSVRVDLGGRLIRKKKQHTS